MKRIRDAFRSILALKQNAFFNWVGLTIGLGSFALILTWVLFHWSFDKFHEDYEQIHLVEYFYDNGDDADLVMPYPMAQFLRDRFSEVQFAVTYSYWPSQTKLTVGENEYFEFLTPTEHDIFHILDFDFISRKSKLFVEPSDVVINESLAIKIFGSTQCLGETLIIADSLHGMIAGVYRDFSSASTFAPPLLCAYNLCMPAFAHSTEWNTYSYYTLVKLSANVNIDELNKKLTDEVHKELEDEEDAFGFYPLTKIHLNHPGESSMKNHLLMVLFCGFLVLLVSCINFVNLLTSGFLKKNTQTTIRRVLGASRADMIKSSLLEVLIYVLAALITSLVIMFVFWPFIQSKLGIDLDVVFDFSGFIIIHVLTAVFVYIIALAYPVTLFWRKFYKQKSMVVTTQSFRLNKTGKSFVVMQFVVAIFIGIVAFVMQEQLKHAINTDKGYSVDNVFFAECWDYPVRENESAIRAFLDGHSGVVSYSITENSFSGFGSRTTGFAHPAWTGEKKESYRALYRTDENLLKTAGISLVAGRFFEPKNFNEEKNVVINETYAKQLGGIDSALSLIVEDDYRIIGVCDDFLFESFYSGIEPLVILYNTNWVRNILVKTYQGSKNEVLAGLNTLLRDKSNAPFRLSSMNDLISDMYSVEASQKKLASLFGLLTILVSCMGLFGLSVFIAEQKTKEVGVRKVNGATVYELIIMLNRDFIIWVIIAFTIAAPLAYFVMKVWLESFAYKTTLSWWVFALAGCSALVIALLTVSWQTFKAARKNPIEALRYE